MTVLFEAVDPRGWQVVCTEQQWNEHVLAFHGDDMEGYEADVQKTIAAPLYGMIFSDRDDESRAIYYGRRTAKTYLKVVVDFDEQVGFLITAFPVHQMKSGEFPIWHI
jgi:hypothetical protein